MPLLGVLVLLRERLLFLLMLLELLACRRYLLLEFLCEKSAKLLFAITSV